MKNLTITSTHDTDAPWRFLLCGSLAMLFRPQRVDISVAADGGSLLIRRHFLGRFCRECSITCHPQATARAQKIPHGLGQSLFLHHQVEKRKSKRSFSCVSQKNAREA